MIFVTGALAGNFGDHMKALARRFCFLAVGKDTHSNVVH